MKFDHEMKVLNLLGTLWSQNYKNNSGHLATVEANLDALQQSQTDLQEAIDCTDRHTVPIYHTELRTPVILRDHVANNNYPLAKGLVELPILTNRITSPSLFWHSGIDYEVHVSKAGNSYIRFNKDPFADELLPQLHEETHRELLLWGHNVKFERNYLARHFGCLLGLEKSSSEEYRALLNAIFDTWALGTTSATLSALVHTLLGVPLAQKDGEVVKGCYFDVRSPFVVTDVQLYRIPDYATASVLRGHRLYRGEPVVKLAKITPDAVNSRINITFEPKIELDMTILQQAIPPNIELCIN